MEAPRLDHVILHTRDIDRAAAEFAAAGFTVQSRDDAAATHGTESRFVVFEGGAYLLLMQFTDPERMARHRLARFLATDTGLVDYGIRVGDGAAAMQRAEGLGLTPTAPGEMRSRLRSGAEWGVRLFTPGRGAPAGRDALPFVVQDLGAPEARIPAFRPHANDALRIAAVHVQATDPAAAAAALAAIAGLPAGAVPVRMGRTEVAFHPPRPDAAGTAGKDGATRLTLAAAPGTPARSLTLEGARLDLSG